MGTLVVVPRCDVSDLRVIDASTVPSSRQDHDYITWSNVGDWADLFFALPKNSARLEPFSIGRWIGEVPPNLKVSRMTVGALTLPVLTNTRSISAHTELALAKPKSDNAESFDQRILKTNAAAVRKKAEKDEAKGKVRQPGAVGGDGASGASLGVDRTVGATVAEAASATPPAIPPNEQLDTGAVLANIRSRKRLGVKKAESVAGAKKTRGTDAD